MKTDFLKGLGLEKEVIDQILAENGRDIEVEKGKLKELQQQLEDANNTIKERDKQLEKLKNSSGDVEELKNQITTLQTENKTAKQEYEKHLNEVQLNSAIERDIVATKAKNVKAVKALLDLSKLKLKEDGTVEGLKEQLDGFQKTDEYLFEKVETKLSGTEPASSDPNPNPSGNKPDSQKTYLDFVREIEARK